MNVMQDASGAEPAAAGRAGTIVPVILSGGAGTRLWPLSRESFPKPLWPLLSERSLIQATALRASGAEFAPPLIVAGEAHRFLIAEQMQEAGIAGARIVLEPEGRNSGPAIAAASLLVAESDPGAVIWMMAADAAIGEPDSLGEALAAALPAARAGWIVTFGMKPTRAETGYGWIEPGAEIAEAPQGAMGARAIARFIEKPDPETAARLFDAGFYLWNSGMFVFRAGTLIEELALHAPELLAAVRQAVATRSEDPDFIRLGAAAFLACPNISLDVAVAERTERAAVVAADLGWSDIGSWHALWEIGAKDEAGNVAVGDVMLEDSSDCYVRSDGRLAAVVGLKDVVVVATEDAVLAVHRERAQDVKAVVDRLKAAGRAEAVSHRRVYRPWGFYESLMLGERFQVKRIVVKPGGILSLQKHFHRAEHWTVVEGSALVTVGGEKRLVSENESVFVPLGAVHRMENPGRIPFTLIEVQSGSYLGEDDIVRLEDSYGRA
ncbi:MAG TPA: mannose-1-phosphate guanylyltransferase/mannose-6-phosphate isomerase [Acetobacteraceae bacterium]|nr:mannose-1-phosphate guanylyltransferase/mannose-6-phosphate isomerase [Acetobacteraceae bacterium]